MKYTTANNLTGWLIFAIAMVTYWLTLSPTASFWDCGEFIATANELEVPHPPGAPLFLMVGRVFAMFAPDVTKVAMMVNLVSAVSSAAMAMLICWTVTILAKKVLAPTEANPDQSTQLTILFAGAIAGLTCTWLDTVWFNAVEAEVYAVSSFFTCLVFWLILKWEARADEADHLKWIVLIAYLMGLSVGVHLLNLLTIPAMALIYYFRKYPYSLRGLLATLGISVVILGALQVGVIQKTWDIAWSLERLFVGSFDLQKNKDEFGLGLPFGSGALFFAILLFGGLAAGIVITQRRKMVALNTIILCTLMVYLGFSSYLTILIRSNVDPPIDQNHPATLASFLGYVKREQYGDKPLFYGQMYNTQVIGYEKTEPFYTTLEGKDVYVKDGDKQRYQYDPKGMRFFPRMSDPDHYRSGPFGYQKYVKNKGGDANNPNDDKPTGLENLKFFFEYQVYHMYIRYFLWNFSGRSSDRQHAEAESGLEFSRFKDMPESMKSDRTRNHYYLLPLILGILGLVWHVNNDPKRAGVVALLFFFTGLAIVIYLNQVAQEPRERDYAFVGSYHTFVIWVGLGVVAIADMLKGLLKRGAPIVAFALSLSVPGILLAENWDDHDRHGQYVAPDSAYNLLNSCAKDAVLFTNGDNDTFPLWYLQEVEGVRTDVRVVNLSLVNTDWYIYQLKHKQWNDSKPLPISLADKDFLGERNSAVQFPARSFEVAVDKDKVLANGTVAREDADRIASPMVIRVQPRGSKDNPYLMKQDLVILDMVITNATNGWERPIYFANTVASSSFVSLGDYLQLEGMAYRVVPVKQQGDDRAGIGPGRIALNIMYDNAMKFKLRGLDDPKLFFGETVERMVANTRSSYYRLATGYLDVADRLEQGLQQVSAKGNTTVSVPQVEARVQEYEDRALKVMEYVQANIRDEAVPLGAANRYLYAMVYDRLGKKEEAEKLLESARAEASEKLKYLQATDPQNEDLNDYYFVMQRGLEYVVAQGDSAKIVKWANDLFAITSDVRYKQLSNQYLGAPAKPDSVGSSVLPLK
jgi:hypothetical protein